ncbi:MAG: hypothetical protein BroJett018_48050 [Chloroflexota bacterium]|nr:MAG: hypothetical protein BroJett018_48050 [Chloroflexota bacterium]
MNANNWPLHEMEREVYTVPYSLDECQARLEQLDEPEPRPRYFVRYEFTHSRTKVVKLIEHSPTSQDVVYCLQRRRLFEHSGSPRDVYAEMNVALEPLSATTLVILYSSRRMTKAQKSMLASSTAIILTFPIIFGLSSSERIAAVGVGFLFILPVIAILLAEVSFHFWRQKKKLRRQITKALTLEPHMKE